MTYNLLANSLVDYADPDFAAIPEDVLAWRPRSARLQNELRTLNPDLACLQELDSDCVDEFLRPFARDYAWQHKARTGDNRDGCALLWKPAVFELLEYRAIEFKNMLAADGATPLAFMDRDNVAQVAALRHRNTDRVVIVANCHLLFNQNRGDIKLAQILGMLRLVAEFKRAFAAADAEPAVFIGGDFNSTPISGVYALMANGVLDVRDIDMRLVSGQQLRVSRIPPPPGSRASIGQRKATELRSVAEIAVHCFGAAPILSPASDDNDSSSAVVEPVDKKPKVGVDDENDDIANEEDEDDGGAARFRRQSDSSDSDDDSTALPVSGVDPSKPIVLHHTLGLASAYPRASELSRNSATCMRKHRFDQRWVDHIFTSSQLRVLSVLAVPKNCRDKISPFGLPTRNHPSDHLPLCAVLEFANK
jgi:mRNA deadenylase 3'-5' endonuclease subunit Ccr4